MNTLISIIIPVYNGEKYVNDCLTSVYKDIDEALLDSFEVIIVNDGSKDNSLAFIKKWQEQYRNCILIDKKNGGVSSARNIALKKARGEFITFLDIDDMFAKHAVAEMIQTILASKADLYIFNYNEISEDGSKFHEMRVADTIKDNLGKLQEAILLDYTMNASWGKIYKKNLIESNHIEFDTELKFGEDVRFVTDYCVHIKNVKCVYETLYLYRQLPNGAVMSMRANLSNTMVANMSKSMASRYRYAEQICAAEDLIQKLNVEMSNEISAHINQMLDTVISLEEKERMIDNVVKDEFLNHILRTVLKQKNVKLRRKIMILCILNRPLRKIYIKVK